MEDFTFSNVLAAMTWEAGRFTMEIEEGRSASLPSDQSKKETADKGTSTQVLRRQS